MLDASCTPADIAYPTDLSLLNEASEKMESIIDTLHSAQTEKSPKPRTYREKARKAYLVVAKQRKAGIQKICKALGKQLKFVARDLRIIEKLASETGSEALSKRQYKSLLVVQEVYRQQLDMYQSQKHQVEDRIVNLTQPHVRPIDGARQKQKWSSVQKSQSAW